MRKAEPVFRRRWQPERGFELRRRRRCSGGSVGPARAQLLGESSRAIRTAAFSGDELVRAVVVSDVRAGGRTGQAGDPRRRSRWLRWRRRTRRRRRPSPRVAFVQDARGNVVPVPRSLERFLKLLELKMKGRPAGRSSRTALSVALCDSVEMETEPGLPDYFRFALLKL